MENKKNTLLLAASICLILLAVISLGYSLYTNLSSNQVSPSNNMGEMSAMGEGDGNFSPEDVTGQSDQSEQMDQSEQPEQSEQSEQSMGEGQDDSTMPEGFDDSQRTQGDFSQQGDFSGNFDTSGISGVNNTSWLAIGIYAVVLILAVLAAIFILKGKRLGIILGVFLSISLAGAGLLSLFSGGNWLHITVSSLKSLLGIGVIVLVFRPGARKVYKKKKKDIFDEDDYALYYGNDEAEENADDEAEENADDETESEPEPE